MNQLDIESIPILISQNHAFAIMDVLDTTVNQRGGLQAAGFKTHQPVRPRVGRAATDMRRHRGNDIEIVVMLEPSIRMEVPGEQGEHIAHGHQPDLFLVGHVMREYNRRLIEPLAA